MRASLALAAVLVGLALTGCELVVDPKISPTGSTSVGTTVGNGATTGRGSAASASASGSAGSIGSTGSGSAASSSASSSNGAASTGSSGSSSSASSSSGAASTGSSSGSAGSSGSSGSSAGSSGSSGSTGGPACPGPFGSTGSQATGCPTQLQPEAALDEFPLRRLADSVSSCDGGVCPGLGTDGDYAFPVDAACPLADRVRKGTLSSTSYPFDQLPLSTVVWQRGGEGGDTYSAAQTFCTDGAWTGQAGRIALPTASQLVELLDFGKPGLVPAGLDPKGGPGWAQTAVGNANLRWQVDFTTGAFNLVDTSPVLGAPTGTARCVDAAAGGSTPTVGLTCTGGPDGGSTCVMDATLNGTTSPTTGLAYFLPTVSPNLDWAQALRLCATLDGTCGVWRLPSYKELAGLVNFTANATRSDLDTLSGTFWSSTISPAVAGQAMVVKLQPVTTSGGTPGSAGFSEPVAASHQVLCVQGP